MRVRRHSYAVLFIPLSALSTLACNDSNPTYPAIIIYGNPDALGAGNNTGSGNNNGSGNNTGSGNPSSSGGSSNANPETGGGSSNDLYAHCNTLWSGEDPPLGKVKSCDIDSLPDAGELSGDISADKTLKSGNAYRLKGSVRVLPGVTLTVEPCVKIIGEGPDAVLAVLSGALGDPTKQCKYNAGEEPGPGGKLIAVGEPMAPIVFTSAKPKGQRNASDWGGVILMGNGLNNLAKDNGGIRVRVPIEGLSKTECFGWPTDKFNDESSGKLEYVRIEYASRKLSADNETNGLTLGALGSGTELHYVEVANSGDDCFEWFGGAVNGDHLIALNCDDDGFDGDNGFSGKLQFLFGRQGPTTTEVDSRGFEIDGAPSALTLPFTSEQISNFTVCGGGPTDSNSSRDGVILRKDAAVKMMNGYVTGFANAGFMVEGGPQAANDKSSMTYVDVFDNAAGLSTVVDASNGMSFGVPGDWFLNQPGNSPAEPDRFCNCWANPPVPVPAHPDQGAAPVGFDDASADYLGAFKDASAASNWMRGAWVDWAAN